MMASDLPRTGTDVGLLAPWRAAGLTALGVVMIGMLAARVASSVATIRAGRAAMTRTRIPVGSDPPFVAMNATLDVTRSRHRPGTSPPTWFTSRIQAMAIGGPVAIWWYVTIGVAVAVPLGAFLIAGAGLAVVVTLLVCGGAVAAVDLIGDRASRQVDGELPVVLEGIADAQRSGSSLAMALREAAAVARGPVRSDLVGVVRALDGGSSTADALHGWCLGRDTNGVRLAVAALEMAQGVGRVARSVDGVAVTLRDRGMLDRELRALTAQGRASAVVIIAAPAVLMVLMGTTDPTWWPFFTRSPIGLGCLAGGCLLDAVGAWWMARITRSRSCH